MLVLGADCMVVHVVGWITFQSDHMQALLTAKLESAGSPLAVAPSIQALVLM